MDVRAVAARGDLDADRRDLVIPEGHLVEDLLRGRARVGVGRRVAHVAAGVGLVPEDLGEPISTSGRAPFGVGSRSARPEVVEVGAAVEQRAVVDAGDAEHEPLDVLREGRQHAAEDPALAVAVVEEAARVDHGLAADLEGRVAREAVRVRAAAARAP